MTRKFYLNNGNGTKEDHRYWNRWLTKPWGLTEEQENDFRMIYGADPWEMRRIWQEMEASHG